MKMYEVLSMVAKGEVKDGDTLEIIDEHEELYKYKYNEANQSFRDTYSNKLEDDFEIDKDFLNFDVELTQVKKYYLRLDEDDSFSYINKNVYLSYEVASKSECTDYKTKFTQEEIDECMLLKFIEQHGIKEEVND